MTMTDSVKKKMVVRNTDGTVSSFKKDRIKDSLIREASMSYMDAMVVADEVSNRIKNAKIEWLSGALIREMVNSVLSEMGHHDARRKYTRVGIPVKDIDLMIYDPQTFGSNANLQRNPETIAKVVHDQVMEQHTFLTLPDELADAHLVGDIYIKDREYFSVRDYCATWDMRQFLYLGIEPGGNHSSYATPARHAAVVMNHAAIWLAAAQSNFSGGQGYFFFNTFIAPYLVGKTPEEIRQIAQQFIYTMTQTYVSRGGQVTFSSVDLSPGIPSIMEDVSAVGPGGIHDGVYGDYHDEAREFFDQFMLVMINGDGNGKPFNFPKPNIVLRKEFIKPEYDESWRKVAMLTALHGSPYFESYLAPYRADIEAGCSSCCSHLWTASTDKELEEFKSGNMVFGASQMVTPNFGRAAWIGRRDEDAFFEELDRMIDLSYGVFREKDIILRKILNNNIVPFYRIKRPDGKPLINPSRRMYLLGTVGFAEMTHIMTGHQMHEQEGHKFAIKVLKHLKNRGVRLKKKSGLNIAITRTPAESAAGRLAMKDVEQFPDIKRYLHGNGNPYYTNSTQLSVMSDISLSDRINIEGTFHPFMDGGALTNIFLGEANPDPDALWSLLEETAKKTLNAYFTFTKDILVCNGCKYTGGIDWKRIGTIMTQISCPRCHGHDTEIFSRITGYSQGLSSWNLSKQAEFVDRRRYHIAQ